MLGPPLGPTLSSQSPCCNHRLPSLHSSQTMLPCRLSCLSMLWCPAWQRGSPLCRSRCVVVAVHAFHSGQGHHNVHTEGFIRGSHEASRFHLASWPILCPKLQRCFAFCTNSKCFSFWNKLFPLAFQWHVIFMEPKDWIVVLSLPGCVPSTALCIAWNLFKKRISTIHTLSPTVGLKPSLEERNEGVFWFVGYRAQSITLSHCYCTSIGVLMTGCEFGTEYPFIRDPGRNINVFAINQVPTVLCVCSRYCAGLIWFIKHNTTHMQVYIGCGVEPL